MAGKAGMQEVIKDSCSSSIHPFSDSEDTGGRVQLRRMGVLGTCLELWVGVSSTVFQFLRVAVAFQFILCDRPFSLALERERLKVHNWAVTCLGSGEGLMVASFPEHV